MRDTIKYPSGHYTLLNAGDGWVHRSYRDGLNFYFAAKFHPEGNIWYYICHRPHDANYYLFLRDDTMAVLSRVNAYPSLDAAKVGYIMANKVIDMVRKQV